MVEMVPYRPLCIVDGCPKHAHGRDKYCSQHLHRVNTHGHPEQLPVTLKLAPYKQQITLWTASADGMKAFNAIVASYEEAAKSFQRDAVAAHNEMMTTGIRHNTMHNQVAEIVSRTSRLKDSRKTVTQLLALGLMLEDQPRSFRSDTAIFFQAVNVFNEDANVRKKLYSKQTGKIETVTRYGKKSARLHLGRWLMKNYVSLGIQLSRQWSKKLAQERREREELHSLIRASA